MDSDARSIELPDDPGTPRRARAFLEQAIAGIIDEPQDVLLMTSELVSNVVQYAHGRTRMTVDLGSPLRVEVHNHQAASDAFRELVADPVMPEEWASNGRGLALVGQLSSRMGLEDDDDGGKIVWFEYEPDVADGHQGEVVAVAQAGGTVIDRDEAEGPNSA